LIREKPSQWNDKQTGELKHGLNITVSACLSAYDVKKRRGGTGTQTKPGNAPYATGGVGGFGEPTDF
jgi:single-strand DNA-binding protein